MRSRLMIGEREADRLARAIAVGVGIDALLLIALGFALGRLSSYLW